MSRALLSVAIGGALGAVLRWGLGELVPDDGGFPWMTFTINVSGSFLLALLPALPLIRRHRLLPLLVGTGMLGGFTTLSTYAEQGRSLIAAGRPALALSYLLATLVACLVAVVIARRLTPVAARIEFEDEGGDR